MSEKLILYLGKYGIILGVECVKGPTVSLLSANYFKCSNYAKKLQPPFSRVVTTYEENLNFPWNF